MGREFQLCWVVEIVCRKILLEIELDFIEGEKGEKI